MASVDKVLPRAGAKRFRGCGCPEHWLARWRDPTGKPGKKAFCRKQGGKQAAERHGAQMERDKQDRTYVDGRDTTTVTEYAKEWAAHRSVRPTTKRNHGTFIRNDLEGTPLGARPLVKVGRSEFQPWVDDRKRTLGPQTLRRRLSYLRAIFNAAAEDGRIPSSPMPKRLVLPKDERPPVVPLTVEQVQALADAMAERARALVLVQAGLGLRKGELLALRVEDVDFLRREVHVEYQLQAGTLEHAPLKTPRSKRTIPLPAPTAETLARHISAYPPLEDGTIFSSPLTDGPWGMGAPRTATVPGRVEHGQYGEAIRVAARKAGLPEGTTSHDLRHHYASVLLQAGLSVFEVAERLGDTPLMVWKVYGHVMPKGEDRTRKAIEAAWSTAAGGHTGGTVGTRRAHQVGS
jgi:integrase